MLKEYPSNPKIRNLTLILMVLLLLAFFVSAKEPRTTDSYMIKMLEIFFTVTHGLRL